MGALFGNQIRKDNMGLNNSAGAESVSSCYPDQQIVQNAV
jgi:hypothetical protein